MAITVLNDLFSELFCVGLMSLFSVSLLLGSPTHRNVMLSCFLGSLAGTILNLSLFAEQVLRHKPGFFMAYVPFLITCATSLFLFFKLYLEDRQLEARDGIHAIPVVISWASFIAFLGVNSSLKSVWIHELYSGHHRLNLLPFNLITGFIVILYLGKIFRLNPDYASFDFRRRPGLTGAAILVMILVALKLSIATLWVPFAIEITQWLLRAFNILFLIGSVVYMNDRNYFLTWITDIKKTFYKRNYLDEIDVSDTKTKLISLMTVDQIFQDNELSLEKVASQLSISRYQLSQLLNLEMKTTFTQFVQTYRIRAAQQKLDASPHRTILSIAYEVGFNSNSSFQMAFKKALGTSPSEFRNRTR